jgi:hypothetical protein
VSVLRKLARGQDCQVRLPGICNFNSETTVLAHYRLAGTCGTGIKPPDLLAAWACSACHDYIDGRGGNVDKGTARLWHAEGVLRTIAALVKLGKVRGP